MKTITKEVTKLGELEMKKIQIAKECGLTYVGLNEEAELEFVGTDNQWQRYEEFLERGNFDKE